MLYDNLHVQHVYCAKFMLYSDEIRKKLELYVLNQNVNVTKRERFATFAISMVDNLCILMKQHK